MTIISNGHVKLINLVWLKKRGLILLQYIRCIELNILLINVCALLYLKNVNLLITLPKRLIALNICYWQRTIIIVVD